MTANSIGVYAEHYARIAKGAAGHFDTPAENLVRALKVCGLAKGKGRLALDFGCGEGRNAAYLLHCGYRVVATDVSQAALDATGARLGDTFEASLITPGEPLPAADGSLSLIVAWEVLHWLGSKELVAGFLAEAKRALGTGGSLVFTMPTEDHFLKYAAVEFGESRYRTNHPARKDCELYAPNFLTLKAMLAEAGFAARRTMRYDIYDDIPSDEPVRPFSMYIFVADS